MPPKASALWNGWCRAEGRSPAGPNAWRARARRLAPEGELPRQPDGVEAERHLPAPAAPPAPAVAVAGREPEGDDASDERCDGPGPEEVGGRKSVDARREKEDRRTGRCGRERRVLERLQPEKADLGLPLARGGLED